MLTNKDHIYVTNISLILFAFTAFDIILICHMLYYSIIIHYSLNIVFYVPYVLIYIAITIIRIIFISYVYIPVVRLGIKYKVINKQFVRCLYKDVMVQIILEKLKRAI